MWITQVTIDKDIIFNPEDYYNYTLTWILLKIEPGYNITFADNVILDHGEKRPLMSIEDMAIKPYEAKRSLGEGKYRVRISQGHSNYYLEIYKGWTGWEKEMREIGEL